MNSGSPLRGVRNDDKYINEADAFFRLTLVPSRRAPTPS
jgi:hypothetical protein